MDVKVENLDHLGIVAGIIDEIGIVELIDEQVGQHSQQKVSTGQAVKAMILNGLGFVSAPLYLYADLTFPVKSKIQQCKILEPLSGKTLRHHGLYKRKHPLQCSLSLS